MRADEEHHVAKVLIAELDTASANNDHRDAKFTVLAESVRHHIKEEEDQMLPKAMELEIHFEALGQRMLDRKKELLEEGIPPDAEHAMIEKSGANADSPASASAKRPAAKQRSRQRIKRRNYGYKNVRLQLQGQTQDSQSHEGTQAGHAQVRQRQKGQKPKAGRCHRAQRGAEVRSKDSPQEKIIGTPVSCSRTESAWASPSSPASRRFPPAFPLQMQGSIGRDSRERDDSQVCQKACQTRPQKLMRRQADHRRGAKSDRKNSQLNRRRYADEIAASGVVRVQETGRDADHRREAQTGQRAFKAREKNRAALDRSNDGPCRKGQRCADGHCLRCSTGLSSITPVARRIEPAAARAM
jgi:hypothetical protein